jgi:hypothetical protein
MRVYSALQVYLAKRPDAGDLIRGSGGIRKIRRAGKRTRQTGRVEGDLLLVGCQGPHFDAACVSEERAGRFERGSSEATSESAGALKYEKRTFCRTAAKRE